MQLIRVQERFNFIQKNKNNFITYNIIYIMNKLHKYQEHMFDIIVYISYILIIVSSLGLSMKAPIYLSNLDYYIRIYICLFLIWRFNPLRTTLKFTDLDKKIAFSAGVFILTTTTLNEYLTDIKVFFKNKFSNLYKNNKDDDQNS
jgi:hypothetical protein